MREALEFHLAGMREDGEPLPESSCVAGFAMVDLA